MGRTGGRQQVFTEFPTMRCASSSGHAVNVKTRYTLRETYGLVQRV